MPGFYPTGQALGAALVARGGEDHVINPALAQAEQHTQALQVEAQHRLTRQTMLAFLVAEYRVQIGIARQHRFGVAIDQGRYPCLRIARPQPGDQRRGAYQVTDVVAADNQKARPLGGARQAPDSSAFSIAASFSARAAQV